MLFEYSVNINLSIRSTVVICQNTSIKRGHSDFHFQRGCSNRHQIYPLVWNHQNKQTKTQNTPQSIWNRFQDNGQQTSKDQNSWETETNEKGPMLSHDYWCQRASRPQWMEGEPRQSRQLRVKETELRLWGNQGS